MSQVPIKQSYTVSEFARLNGIGLTKVYEEINAGRLRAYKCGRSTMIFEEDRRAWREALPAVEPKAREATAA
jgi:excisionase family DNA binding protein